METTIRLKLSELPSLTKALNVLFKKDETIEITVSEPTPNSLSKIETREETRLRIRKAIENVKNGRNMVVFSEKEFEEFSDSLAAKYKK